MTGATRSPQPGAVARQLSTVTFDTAQTVASGQWHSLMVNGHDYAVAVGDNASIWINTTQSVAVSAKEWGASTTASGVVASAVTGSLGTASVTASSVSVSPLSVSLAGVTVAAGRSYAITIGSTPFSVTATGTTADSLAEQLRNEIDANTELVATLSGSTISVTRQDASRVGTASTPMAGVVFTQAGDSSTPLSVALAGVTVVVGQRYAITIGSTPFSVTATGTTADSLAVQLRDEIDANTDLVATLSGSTISVTRLDATQVGTASTPMAGTALTQSVETVTPLTINAAGWTPVQGASYSITIGSTPFVVQAASGETGATLAENLRKAVDDSSSYTATRSGTTLSVSTQAGARVTETATTAQTPPARTLSLSGMSVVSGARYTVSVGAVSVNLVASSSMLDTFVADLSTALNAASGLDASYNGTTITLVDADTASDVDPLTAVISGTVQSLQSVAEAGLARVTASTEGGQRVSLTGLPVRTDVQYTIVVGASTYTVTAVGSDTLASVTDKLVTAIGATASALKTTVAATWSSVNAALDALIEKGEALTVLQARPVVLSGIKVDAAATYTLTIGDNNVSFTAEAGYSAFQRATQLATLLNSGYGNTYTTRVDGDVLWISSGADVSTITLTSSNAQDTLSVESPDVAARRLTLVADAVNTGFVVNGAAITPLARLAAMPINTTQLASASAAQVTDVGFAGTPAADVLYTVVVGGKAYNARVGLNLGLAFTAGLVAQDSISLRITDEAGVALTNATDRLWLSNVRVTPSGLALPRVLDLTGLPVAAGYVYTVTAGDSVGTFTAVAGSTAQNVLTALAADINSASAISGVTVVAQSATVSAAWIGTSGATGVLDLLKTRLEADNLVNAVASGSTLTLTAKAVNTAFSVGAVYASATGALVGDAGKPQVTAGASATQVSRIVFANDAVAGDDFELVTGMSFAVTMGLRSYSATIGQASVTADWSSILSKLASLIETGENLAVDAGYAAATALQPFAAPKLTVTSDVATRSLTITARTPDMAFSVSATAVNFNGSRAVVGAVDSAGAAPVVNAGTAAKQTSQVSFAGASVSATVSYSVSINGVSQVVKVGDAIPGAGTVTLSWDSVLGELARKLTAAGVVRATVVGQALQLEAVLANASFTLSAFGSDANVSGLVMQGDYVLVLPSRPSGPYSLSSATGSLTVVNLPTTAGETITLGANNSLVVVSPINVGTNGSVTLTAGSGLTLGGKLTAGRLNATAGSDLNMSSQVGVMNLALSTASGASPSNLTLNQSAPGNDTASLTIETLAMSGGNVDIIADGDVIINSITGSVGTLRIVTTGGNVWIKSMADGAAVTIDASGYVTLGNRAAWATGASDTTIEASSLNLVAGGAITVYENNAVVVEQIRSKTGAAVSLQAGGAVTLKCSN